MTATPMCPTCQASQSDWLMCKLCVARLRSNLAALPGYLRELDTNLTRQSRMTVQDGPQGKGKARPLPYDIGAQNTIAEIRGKLIGWVRELDLGDTVGLADNPRAWAHWLLARIERIRGHAAASELVLDVEWCCRRAQHSIDRPADRILIGNCTNPDDATDAAGELIVCSKMYARRDEKNHRCASCKHEYDVEEQRREMLRLIEHQWATVASCSNVLATFGVEVKADTIQNWARRGRLDRRGEDTSKHALYRIGDVIALTHEAVQRAQSRQAEKDERKARRLANAG